MVYTLKISGVKLDMVGPVREPYSRSYMKSLNDSVRDLLEGLDSVENLRTTGSPDPSGPAQLFDLFA